MIILCSLNASSFMLVILNLMIGAAKGYMYSLGFFVVIFVILVIAQILFPFCHYFRHLRSKLDLPTWLNFHDIRE